MEKWKGSLEDLRVIVEGTSIPGDWRSIDSNQEQFRSRDGAILCWWRSTGKILLQGPTSERDALRDALKASSEQFNTLRGTGTTAKERGKQIFVVHGHDNEAREQLELVLHRLHLEPFVLANTAGGGLTIIEALEEKIGKKADAEFGIVLVTPDDTGYSVEEGANGAKPRARQNVVLEMGMLMSSLGRSRVAILVKGFVDLPSDTQGIIHLRFDKHVREVVPKLAERLQAAGFILKPGDVTAACS
jgi:predicted nucleotide-binding protein